MLIEMQVAGLSVDPMTEMPILILKDKEGNNPLPIWIGLIEAGAIATELERIDLARPMTHDLMKSILERVGVEVVHVEITDLRENTYFAHLVLRQGTNELVIDARPSDAIALALRAGCPIRVDDSVIAKARDIDLRAKRGQAEAGDEEAATDVLSSMPDEEFGKWKM